MWKDAWKPNPCYHSSILKSFVRYILTEYKIPNHTYKSPNSTIRILLSSRHVLSRNETIERRVTNEQELIELMSTQIRTVTDNVVPVNVTVIDFGTIPFEEQLQLIQQTDIFIGMHGAGMTHTMFLPDESVVIELFPKGFHSSMMRNLCKWTGKIYLGWQNMHFRDITDHRKLWTRVSKDEFLHVIRSAIKIVQGFHTGNEAIYTNNRYWNRTYKFERRTINL
jgi:protein O-GlcNAc transferase